MIYDENTILLILCNLLIIKLIILFLIKNLIYETLTHLNLCFFIEFALNIFIKKIALQNENILLHFIKSINISCF